MKKSIQDRIKGLKDAINPMHAMSGMVKMFIPQLGDTLRMMETSVEDGGILKEGEQKAAFVIVNNNGHLCYENDYGGDADYPNGIW